MNRIETLERFYRVDPDTYEIYRLTKSKLPQLVTTKKIYLDKKQMDRSRARKLLLENNLIYDPEEFLA